MTTPESEWTLVAKPRKSRRYAIGVAVLLVVVHVTFAILLRGDSTGVYFRLADQLAFAGIGCLLAAGVLLLTRPRVRIGPRGIAVRNVLGERIVDWDLYEGLSFPDGAAWARIELPDDEYLAVMAIQSNDREYAVDAVDRFRALASEYATS
ncbi:PH domain-containing protein [Rhodococcus sp. USK10]|uniref:Possible conserved membrane protein n=1 Tax=Rhodococcus wratislaviensis TaxID=44752 RepID=A0A402C458_RHOWR|nr:MULTISPECIES: PH domain-containing protein [Rhodococcus]QYB04137.1 PH domain-containing protein [Rhodococcus sp. USK10]GCE38332.1 possible conserved membrane protein [Rhodococcus wratislaviensis]